MFDTLAEDRQNIESELGEELAWDRLDAQRSCRISVFRAGSIDDLPPLNEEHVRWIGTTLDRFRRVFSRRLQSLPIATTLGSEPEDDADE